MRNNITPLCDNNAYVIKLQRILKDYFYLKSMVGASEEEAYTLIHSLTPRYFSIEHVYGYQDNAKAISSIDTKGKLNMKSDAISTSHSLEPVNLHLLSTVIAIYINK